MRRLMGILALLLAAAAVPTSAQTLTQVSGTITDPNGLPYSYANIQITLQQGGPSPTLTPCPGGNCIYQPPTLAVANSAGTFNVALYANASILPSGTHWQFTVTAPGVAPPFGLGPQQFILSNVTIAGSSQSLSSAMSALATAQTFPFGVGTTGVISITGDGALITNVASTGAVTLTLGAAAADTVWGNCTTGAATPSYCRLVNAMLPATAVTPGAYTNANITVNQQGVITAAANGSASGGVSSFSGDGAFANNSASTGAVTLTLATAGAHKYFGNNTGSTAAPGYDSLVAADLPSTAVTPGSYTNTNITVDQQGRITAAANGSGGSGPGTGTQYEPSYWATTSTLGSAAFAPTPNGVPQSLVMIPSGSALTAPVGELPGVVTRAETASTDTILATDCNPGRVSYGGSAAVAVTLPTATTLAVPNCVFRVANNTSGSATALTVTPTTWTVRGGSSITIAQGQVATFYVDPAGSNWEVDIADEPIVAGSNITITRGQYGPTIASTGSNGLSGMTTGQVAIAATASTITSSEALAGSGAGITTGPVSGVTSGHVTDFTGTGGQIADSGAVAANLVVASSPGAGIAHFAGSTQTVTSSAVVGADMASATVTATQLAAQYAKLRCEPGLGDGLNAIPAGTYLQFNCVNTSGVTWTITGISCWTDNAGTSSLNAANNAATGLLTGAVTCNNTKSGGGAAGTQSGTTTLANNDAISFTFVADGTSKQATFTVSLTQ